MAVGANFYAYPSGVEEGDLSTHFERHCARLNHTKTAYWWLTSASSTHGATAVNGTWMWSLQHIQRL